MSAHFKFILFTFLFLSIFTLSSCGRKDVDTGYGVFLSVTDDLEKLSDYDTVVIDAQFFSAEDIGKFKAEGHEVISYINIGSIEDWRDYYEDYSDLTLGEYEHWEEEYWIDVSDERWQKFIVDKLIPELIDKGVDGFFVDNCDVYYHYPEQKTMDGVSVMMKAMVATGKKVLINGGDAYLDAYCEAGGKWNDVITGINQETVFSAILWDEDKFGKAEDEDRKYFSDYIERYASQGADIYLLEYTTDNALIKEIRYYCRSHKFRYYISDSLELDG